MHILKRTLSVLLCCVLLASCALTAHAEKITIEKVSATFDVPYAGEAFDFDSVSVPDDAHYSANIVSVVYSNGGYQYLSNGDTVVAGVLYTVRIRFAADEGYVIEHASTEFEVNGEAVKSFGGVNMPQVYFIAAAKPSEEPDPPAPEKPTFWSRVVSFFRTVFYPITWLVHTIRSWFGF